MKYLHSRYFDNQLVMYISLIILVFGIHSLKIVLRRYYLYFECKLSNWECSELKSVEYYKHLL